MGYGLCYDFWGIFVYVYNIFFSMYVQFSYKIQGSFVNVIKTLIALLKKMTIYGGAKNGVRRDFWLPYHS